jgi:tetratricopeptide (TPR) repeat protein
MGVESLAMRAVKAAMEGKWEEAVEINKAILRRFPTDVPALNRLGRALLETGRMNEAWDAYSKAAEVDPGNHIAQKNLQRLSQISSRAPQRIFLLSPLEGGKMGIVNLIDVDAATLASLFPGDEVYLREEGGGLSVTDLAGKYIGKVDPSYGGRLLRLIRGGNKYRAGLLNLDEGRVRVVVKEEEKSPELQNIVSFLPSTEEERPRSRRVEVTEAKKPPEISESEDE